MGNIFLLLFILLMEILDQIEKILLFPFRIFKKKRNKTSATTSDNHQIIKCNCCSQNLRIPKIRGLIAVTCPKCKNVFHFDTGLKTERNHSSAKNTKSDVSFDDAKKSKNPESSTTNIKRLKGVRSALSSAKEIKRLLIDFGEKMKLLGNFTTATPSIEISPIAEMKDSALYTAHYIHISLKLFGFPDEHTFESLSSAFAMAYMATGEESFTDPDVISMVDTIGPLFNTTSVEYAKRFVPYVGGKPNESYVQTLFRVFARYKSIRVDTPGYYDFIIQLPEGLFTEILPDGQRAVTKDNLNKFIDLI